jgi:hypothetical protein
MNNLCEFMGEESLFDNETKYITAGSRGQEEGQLFEDRVEEQLKAYNVRYRRRAPFKCPYSGSRRFCDFVFWDTEDNRWFLECKQLSDLGTHKDKTTAHYDMAELRAYGDRFCLLYDVYDTGNLNHQQKLEGERKKAKRWQKLCNRSGVVLEFTNYYEFVPKFFG